MICLSVARLQGLEFQEATVLSGFSAGYLEHRAKMTVRQLPQKQWNRYLKMDVLRSSIFQKKNNSVRDKGRIAFLKLDMIDKVDI